MYVFVLWSIPPSRVLETCAVLESEFFLRREMDPTYQATIRCMRQQNYHSINAGPYPPIHLIEECELKKDIVSDKHAVLRLMSIKRMCKLQRSQAYVLYTRKFREV